MENTVKYCTNCGIKVSMDASFCQGCGTQILTNTYETQTLSTPSPITTPPLVPPSPPPVAGEKILASIPVQTQEKLIIFKPYVLIFTEERIIFVKVTNEMTKREAQRAAEEAKANGKGILGRMAASAFSGYNISRRFFDMTVQEILSESQENFFVKNNEVRKLKFRESRFTTDSDNNSTTQPGKIVIDTLNKKYKLTMTTQSEERQLKNLLKSLFGSRFGGGIF